MAHNLRELKPEELRWRASPGEIACETTEKVEPLGTIIGQERAMRALEFGLEMTSPGFNIYIAGAPGTGKTTICKSYCERVASGRPVPPDLVFVNNFDEPERPVCLLLPVGTGKALRKDMEALIRQLRADIPRAFEGETHEECRKELHESAQRRQQAIFRELEERARKAGFAIRGAQGGFVLIPLIGGEPAQEEQFNRLPREVREELDRKRIAFNAEIADFVKEVKGIEKELRQRLAELDREIGLFAVAPPVEELRERYREFDQVVGYLERVREHVLEHLDDFRRGEEGEGTPAFHFVQRAQREEGFRAYEVNVAVDNSEREAAPVVVETNPTYNNLFGRVEKRAFFGTYTTDFTMIRAGSLLRANGGFLVVNALDALVSPGVWPALKRVIRNREVRIEELGELYGFTISTGVKPAPIPVDLKVVMIGSPYIYYLLFHLDEDFSKMFKVKADFDHQMERKLENIGDYVAFIAFHCRERNLKPFDRSAVARVVEYGARLAADQRKLSARFSEVLDLMLESHHWASRDGGTCVTGEHVQRAIREKVFRSDLIHQRIKELIAEGTLLVGVAGEEVGQVNGLAVMAFGDYSFAKPSRITAQAFMGEKGVINIERESRLSGRIHDKGVLILSGYLGAQYARKRPLALSASLCFEQSYEGVEGDSASSTELYALLSGLSGLPIKQGIAVTGSVNQKGELQPIGGVNEKVEGFFDVCRAVGELTGEQGVLIPHQNVKNLMLKEEVVEAVAEGRFHIYSVRTVDEGVEILTGVPAGERGPDGEFPPESVHGRVEARLREFFEELQRIARRRGREREEEREEEEVPEPRPGGSGQS
ncbi:MAG: Lon protease family protein [Nitrospinota bacterium]